MTLMKKITKNRWLFALFMIAFCIPLYLFTLIGEFYEHSQSFTFLGVTVEYWTEVWGIITNNPNRGNYRYRDEQVRKKAMNKEIRIMKKDKLLPTEYRDTLVKILKNVKELGYGPYDGYFLPAFGSLDYEVCFKKNSYRNTVYFTIPEVGNEVKRYPDPNREFGFNTDPDYESTTIEDMLDIDKLKIILEEY